MTSQLILASASFTRRRLLNDAGIEHVVDVADVNEAQIKSTGFENPQDLSECLAQMKALAVSARHPDAMVIGADQVLVLGEEILDKPGSSQKVSTQLKKLRGHTHTLLSSVSVAQNNHVLWTYTDQAHMQMRDFSDTFLNDYVKRVGDQVASSVGAYHLEGLGAQLFDRVDGDYFTVLGLPLLPLLNFLRAQSALKT
ncbi:MAG: Maf family protein [Magnetovibrio sp.]|nr:Maf family protein [Magnetovibrio sp.]